MRSFCLPLRGVSCAVCGAARAHSTDPVDTPLAPGSSPRPPRRITKRRNYADYEATANVREDDVSGEKDNTAATVRAARAYDAQLRAAQATTHFSGHVPGNFAASSHTRPHWARTWQAWRERLLLELLQTRRFGVAWAVGAWWRHVMSYAAYLGLGGRIEFYTRRSVAPPPPPPRAEGAAASDGMDDDGSDNSSSAAARRDGARPGRVASTCGVLKGRAHEAIYVGASSIHSRGLFTRTRLPRGTRILTEPQRSFLLAPSYLRLLADTHEKLPETSHYTHPSGSMLELVLQAQPHHLLNHSCEANVVSGLSPVFWEAAAATGRDDLRARLWSWPYFADPNSFFVARDVEAGEELTLDYSVRAAPMIAGAGAFMGGTEAMLQVCRCGTPSCRQFIYRARPDLDDYLHRMRATGRARGGDTSSSSSLSCFDAARDLLAMGVDDETVLLSLLPSKAPLVAYVHSRPISQLVSPDNATAAAAASLTSAPVAAATDMLARRFAKGDIIVCYRHVFRDLNEVAPEDTH